MRIARTGEFQVEQLGLATVGAYSVEGYPFITQIHPFMTQIDTFGAVDFRYHAHTSSVHI